MQNAKCKITDETFKVWSVKSEEWSCETLPSSSATKPPFLPETGTFLSALQTFPLTGELPFRAGKTRFNDCNASLRLYTDETVRLTDTTKSVKCVTVGTQCLS